MPRGVPNQKPEPESQEATSPEPTKSLLVDPSIHLRLKVVAAKSGMTIQQLTEQALLNYLPAVEKKWSK